MLAHVVASPPIGQCSVVEPDDEDPETSQVTFHVALITSDHGYTPELDVQIWHDHTSKEENDPWSALPLTPYDDRNAGNANSLWNPPQSCNGRPHWFSGVLHGRPTSTGNGAPRTKVSFTIRFRRRVTGADGPIEAWKWASDHGGTENGVLFYQPPGRSVPDAMLSHYLDLPEQRSLSVQPRMSETPYTRLWLVTASEVPAAAPEGGSGWGQWQLGSILQQERWFALTRESTPWLAPRQGQQELADGQSLLYIFLRSDGLHVAVLAVSGVQADGAIQTILCRDTAEHALTIVTRNDEEKMGKARVVISVGRSHETALAAVMYEARKLVKSFSPPKALGNGGERQDLPVCLQDIAQRPMPSDASVSNRSQTSLTARDYPVADSRLRAQRDQASQAVWYEDWMSGLGFCTWNSLGPDLTELKITRCLESLSKAGVQISNLIIDDGWQSVDKNGLSNMQQGWRSFEADRSKFPRGLGEMVKNIKSSHPAIKHVAVWHALLGYWAGVARDGEIAQRFKTRDVSVRRGAMISDGKMLVVDESGVADLYEQFYGFLEDAGVTAVKTDAQFALDDLERARDRRELTMTYHRAWQSAYLRYFAGRSISCMAQTPALLFALLAFDYGPELPMRNSEDYFPHVEDSHPWHIFCNAHNAILTSFLNVVPDWDMFQTAHPWASWHAAARCLSGGPIFITDRPGQCDRNLIRSITALRPQGDTVVLRPSVVGRSSTIYCAPTESSIWRVCSYNGAAGLGGTSLLGLFNGQKARLTEVITLSEFAGVEKSRQYVVGSFRSGKTTGAMNWTDKFVFGLQQQGWDILTAYPIATIETATSTVSVASLGLLTHYTGSVALISSSARVWSPASGNLDEDIRSVTRAWPRQSDTTSDPFKMKHHARFEQVTPRLHVTNIMKALGTVGFWLSAKIPRSVSDLFALLDGRIVPAHCVSIARNQGDADTHVGNFAVTIDAETAWQELSLSSRSNELKLELLVPV